jgi:chemosensory pili system protein ChpA (sensor histidine kinase/response regulator)
MNHVIEVGALASVRNELGASLEEACRSLEAMLGESRQAGDPESLVSLLHQVRGTLEMLELPGALRLAEEMETLAVAFGSPDLERREDAGEALMRAMLQLPDYLDHLAAGNRDIPQVLLPLFNDLRKARGAAELSAHILFVPDLDAVLPEHVSAAGRPHDDPRQAAREMRTLFQRGLLGWLRSSDKVAALDMLRNALESLQALGGDSRMVRLWWVGAGLIDAMLAGAQETTTALKRLLGELDREVKRLIDHGEAALVEDAHDDLFRNLLFHCGQVPPDTSPRIADIQQTYRLPELLPDESELAVARASLAGNNSGLFETVALAVKEELARLKDRLDIVLRGGCSDSNELRSLIAALGSLGDTMGMLRLGAARESLEGKANELQSHVDSGATPPDDVLMDVANTLLFVESSVERMGAGEQTAEEGAQIDDHLAAGEYQRVADAVIDEAAADLVQAREALAAYSESGQDASRLAEVPAWLNQVRGGVSLLGETRPAALVGTLARYIENEIIGAQQPVSPQQLDALADAVCSLEYYLENRKAHGGGDDAMAELLEQGIGRLGYVIESEQDPADSLSADTASEALPEGSGGLESGPFDQASGAEATVVSLQPGSQDSTGAADEQYVQDEGEPGPVESIADDVAGDSDEVAAEAMLRSESTPVDEQSETESAGISQPQDDGLAVIGADSDPEILEIFLEEAAEEVARIRQLVPRWLDDAQDSESLATVRRSFHTLKGSGRLVGAMRMGEFAWALENLLNRLIDGSIERSTALADLLRGASDALPELLAQVTDGVQTRLPIEALMRDAHALSEGALPEPATREEGQHEKVSEPATAAENDVAVATAQTSDPAGDDTGQESVVESADVEQQASPDSAEPQTGQPLPASGDDGIMDPLLCDIFSAESRTHLQVITEFLERAQAGQTPVDEPLVRALHTLHGSAHMAEAHAIAELAGGLETALKLFLGEGRAVSAAMCAVLADGAAQMESMLADLPAPGPVPEQYDSLQQRIGELSAELPADEPETVAGLPDETAEGVAHESTGDEHQDANEPEQSPAVAGAGAEEEFYAGLDQELLEIFLEESAENLESIEYGFGGWRRSGDDTEALAQLQRSLHTLKGGARMAGLNVIGALAHAVETLVVDVSEGRGGVREAAMDSIQRAVDRLARMLDEVRNRQLPASEDDLVAELAGLRQQGEEQPGHGPEPELFDAPAEASEAGPEAVGDDPYATVDAQLLSTFVEEADDILQHMDQALGSWKRNPADRGPVVELQRDLHTLKGDARVVAVNGVGDLSHAMESLLETMTENEPASGAETFRTLEQALDGLAGMVENVRHRQPTGSAGAILEALEKLRDAMAPAAPAESPAAADIPAAEADAAPAEAAIPVARETGRQERRARSRAPQEQVRVKADLLDNLVNYAGEVSIYRSRLEQQIGAHRFNLVEMDQTVARLRDQLRALEIETEAQILYRYEREGEVLGKNGGNGDFDPLEMDRYSKMQQLSRSLAESVNDLSSIQNLLENITRESETLLVQQSRVNTELQEGLMRTRMVPFLGLAARMRRIVRQTAQEVGKLADLELSGAEGEMDRTVVDRIIAPIEHMLRNAISHGIEPPQVRREKGKPEAGTIRITLERESSDLVLRIADDGAGIDVQAIRSKAIERGLIPADLPVGDINVLQFILETGFSTAEKVTQVSGRGVGMDVVNSEVKQLGGSLQVETQVGEGTTFTIRLPFTLALNQALLVEVGEDTCAIPLSSVEGIVRMRREDLQAQYAEPDKRFEYGGHAYEVRHLGSVLGTGEPQLENSPKRVPVLLARVGDDHVAFQVENLLGSREIVVKSVGPQISTVRGVSGATILGDGRVIMILDVAALVRSGPVTPGADDGVRSPRVRTDGITVMVVDDSITVRKVTSRLLERNDMNVVAAKDGVDAVSRLQDCIPDIILLDIEMPRMDGFELATHVRNEPRLRTVPIIMITSRTGDKHRQRAMQIGVDRYLGKPFQESELLENINALLEEVRENA